MDILTFLNKKTLNLAIHKKYIYGNLMLYRDARRFIYFTEAILWIICFPTVAFLSDKPPPIPLPTIFLAGSVLWYLWVKYAMHGAILFNREQRRIEVFKDLKFQVPKWTHLMDTIEKIAVSRSRKSAMVFYSVILHFKGGPEGAGKDIPLSLDESEAESIARIMARFARVPAFDWDGCQLWPEVEEEDEDESGDEETEDAKKAHTG